VSLRSAIGGNAEGDGAEPPSGRQIEIHHGNQTAVITEVGAGLRSYRNGSWEILDGYAADQYSHDGRGQLLLPWPNRLRDGRYQFDGQAAQLALTEPARGHAIHGLTRFANWSVVAVNPSRCALSHLLHPQPGYDFTLALTAEFQLNSAGLTVTVTAENRGRNRLPYAAGAHPYLRLEGASMNHWLLRAPARTTLEIDDRAIPTGRLLPVAGTPLDFTASRPIGEVQLDHCFTELERGPDGLAWVELESPDRRHRVSLWLNKDHPYVMLFSGDSLAQGVRRKGLAVEPMTAPPNSFQSGVGLRVINPGETVSTSWGINPFG